VDLKLISLVRRRDKAESRMCNAENDGNRYNHPTIHKYERDVAQDLIDEHRSKDASLSKQNVDGEE